MKLIQNILILLVCFCLVLAPGCGRKSSSVMNAAKTAKDLAMGLPVPEQMHSKRRVSSLSNRIRKWLAVNIVYTASSFYIMNEYDIIKDKKGLL